VANSALPDITTAEANRRKCARYDASLPIAVQAVDRTMAPLGDAFQSFTLDLSQSGVRFFNSRPILSRHAIVEFATAAGTEMRLHCEVIRSKRVGGMFEIAVRFVNKLDASSAPQ